VIRPAIGTLNVWFNEAQTERYSPEEFIWVTLLPKSIHCGVRAGVIIQPSEITTFCSKLGTVLYFLQHGDYKPDWVYFGICDLHPVIPEPTSGWYNFPLCLTSKTVLKWLTGLSVDTCSLGLNTHYGCQDDTNTVLWEWCASRIQNTPSATFCATDCRCTARGPRPSPRSRRLTAWPSAPTVFVFSKAGKAESILISCSLLCRSTFQAVQMSVHKR
jgi:hypothetical protein